MSKKIKKPIDYPQFYCRMSIEKKVEIENFFNEILDLKIIKIKNGDYIPKRNDVIYSALRIGLKENLRRSNK